MQRVELFDNGYGVSVITHGYGSRQGLKELAVIIHNGKGKYDLCYDTPITDDVIGWLTDKEVEEITQKVANLLRRE